MNLSELLDKKVAYKVTTNNGDVFETEAVINGRIIRFEALREEDNDSNDWDIAFAEVQKKKGTGLQGTYTLSTVDKTGSRGELEVFSMIRDSIKHFIEEYKPDRIYFTAAKDSKDKNPSKRSDLYLNLIKKFGNQIPGYKLESRDESSIFDKFILIRK